MEILNIHYAKTQKKGQTPEYKTIGKCPEIKTVWCMIRGKGAY